MKRIIAAILFAAVLAAAAVCTAEGKTVEEIRIDASLGELYGELTVPNTDGPVPLIILSHGFGGDHTGNRDYADHFVKQGFATYNLDFCGGGFRTKSAGTMKEMSVLTEAEDLNAVVNYFQADSRFSCIMLWGASQGGFVSGYVAAQRPGDIRAAVLEFPAIVLQDDAKKKMLADGTFPETSSVLGVTLGRKYNEDAVSFDYYEHIAACACPVLILHGDKDPIVPLRYSERAKEVLPDAELIVYSGQGHGFTGKARSDAMDAETAFFTEHTKEK